MVKMWTSLRVKFADDAVASAGEIIGAIAVETGALGATEVSADIAGSSEWDIYFPANVDHAAVESTVDEVLRRFMASDRSPMPRRSWLDVPERDWAGAWREYFQPLDVPPWFRIVPPWSTGDPPPPPAQSIIIDPGQGFGTGRHESTRLSLISVGELTLAGARALDAGCGSGILSIAAALKGARFVVGVDLDAPSLTNARRNIELNRVDDIVRLARGGPEAASGGRYDCIFCNMLPNEAAPLLPALQRMAAPGGAVALAGFLASEADAIRALMDDSRGRIEQMDSIGEWGRLVWRAA